MDDSHPTLASLSVTHVFYDPADKLSLVCAFLALLPQGLCVVYATLVLFTREAEVALLFAGQLACEVFSFALKRLIKEERPPRIHGKGYGMPSSHAQFVAFWSASIVLFLLLRHRPTVASAPASSNSRSQAWSLPERAALSAVAVVVAAITAWSRVYLSYHTPRQVVVGSVAGVLTAVAWFAATAVLRRSGALTWALDTPVARALRVRDLLVEEDICQAGWEKWEAKMAAKASAKTK